MLIKLNVAVALFLFVSAVSVAAQITTPPAAAAEQSIERLTLSGALMAAVGILFKSGNDARKAASEEMQKQRAESRADLQKKDEQLIKLLESSSALMVQMADSNKELRATIEASVETKRELAGAIQELNVEMRSRPCLRPNHKCEVPA